MTQTNNSISDTNFTGNVRLAVCLDCGWYSSNPLPNNEHGCWWTKRFPPSQID